MDGATNTALLLGAIPPPPTTRRKSVIDSPLISPVLSDEEDHSSLLGELPGWLPGQRSVVVPSAVSHSGNLSRAISSARSDPNGPGLPKMPLRSSTSYSSTKLNALYWRERRVGLHSAPPSMLSSSPLSSSYANSFNSKNRNIRVVARVRPINETERALGNEECVDVKGGSIRVLRTKVTTRDDPHQPLAMTAKEFPFFDSCVSAEEGQDSAFEKFGIPELLDDGLAGINLTLFAYGQTGSGKTYTINDGIIPRSLRYLFDRLIFRRECGVGRGVAGNTHPARSDSASTSTATASEGRSIICGISFCEIYNDAVYDLLLCNNRPLKLKWDAGEGFHAPDVHIQPCNTLQDAMAVLDLGNKRRRQRPHCLNAESSRSHAILTMYLFRSNDSSDEGGAEEPGVEEPGSGGRIDSNNCSKIHFVDLAGSERLKESGNNNADDVQAIRETASINKSLFLLGNVISAIATGQPKELIPYRDTKLTKMLFGSMVYPSKCLMIACCSPCDTAAEESLTTLAYASRFASAPAIPIVRVEREAILIASLRRENRILKEEIRILRAG